MNLCHIITKLELGGAQLSTLHILSRLPKDKYTISLITSSKGMLKPDFRALSHVQCHFLPLLHRPINPLFDLAVFLQIYFILRKDKYSIVHTHSSKAGVIGRWAARLARVPVIMHTVHGWSFNDYQRPLRRKLFIFLERMTAKFTSNIICVSQKDIDTGLKYKIAPEHKFEFIPYGIPIPKFRRSPAGIPEKKRGLGILNDDPVIGMISCLKPQKSPLDFVQASLKIYEQHPRVNFLLVGDGVLRGKCKKLLNGSPLNGRFIFTGWRRDVSEILDVMDVAVLTSKWEGMPISVMEALCKGCPVVATGVGGTPELIKNRVNGFLTQPGSHEEVAAKTLEILSDTNLFHQMKAQAASSIDETFCVDRMTEKTADLYKKMFVSKQDCLDG
ncbi:MAG: glycosyltransferase family 4 protein [Candidatus Omnitrophica bacterium]|nr:glycosyltransferase family 4 protein [Candidatus Omnitrophota bacterium]